MIIFFIELLFKQIQLSIQTSHTACFSIFNPDHAGTAGLYKFQIMGNYIDGNPSYFSKLWNLYSPEEPRCLQQMKVYSLSLLASLLNTPVISPANRHTFYTKYQVEIAKKAEQMLTMDLSQHHPAHELAASFSISETSLKNYFRGVYGENISSYMQKKRMEKAGELLLDTTAPVSEVALFTGYSSQSKFAAVFRKHYGTAPLEFRRRCHQKVFCKMLKNYYQQHFKSFFSYNRMGMFCRHYNRFTLMKLIFHAIDGNLTHAI